MANRKAVSENNANKVSNRSGSALALPRRKRPLLGMGVAAAAVVLGAAGLGRPALAQVTYTVGADPQYLDGSQLGGSGQRNVAADGAGGDLTSIESIVTTGTVANTLGDVASGVVVQSNVDNAVSATTDGNLATFSLDLVNASGTGATSDSVIAAAQENLPDATNQNDFMAFAAELNGISVTSSVQGAGAGSTLTLTGNTLAADLDLNQATNTQQGTLNAGFANTEVGTTGASAVDVEPTGTLFTGAAGMEAGFAIMSAQINQSVSSNTANDTTATTFVDVINADVGQTVTNGAGDYGGNLSIAVSGNAVSASFTGNNVDNLIGVTAADQPSLESAAGIASVQVNSAVGDGNTTNASVDGTSSIFVSVTDAAGTSEFNGSSLSFADNAISASATGNLAESDISIAAGIDVDQPAGQTQSNTLTLGAAAQTFNTQGGLFVANAQLSEDSPLVATATGGAIDLAVDVDESLISASVTAENNRFTASALGNDASGSITVAGANAFDAIVASTSLQSFEDSDDTADNITATASGGDLVVDLARDSAAVVTGSAVTVEGNRIGATATANRTTMLDTATGSVEPTIAVTASTITDTLASQASSTIDTRTGNDVTTVAGLSAVSVQTVRGATGGTAMEVDATTSAGNVTLTVGNDTLVTGSSFVNSGNFVTSEARLNLAATGVSADASTSIDASSAIASAQVAADANVDANTSGSVTTQVDAAETGGADSSGVTLLVGDGNLADATFAGNAIGSTAIGQSSNSDLSISAGTSITVTGVINGATDSLRLDATGATAFDSVAAAEMSVLSEQRIDGSTITADTTAVQLLGSFDNGAAAASNLTIAVDGNQVTATARANATDNSLSFDAAAVDMTAADAAGAGGAAGTNLASLGSIQTTATGDTVTATVDSGVALEVSAIAAGAGALTGATISADRNLFQAMATGNTATNELAASGSTLSTPGALATLAGITPADETTDSDLEIAQAAIATGVLQDGNAAVDANLGTGATGIAIAADTNSTGTTNTLTLSADGNTALAMARGVSATTATTLDYSDVTSTAVIGVQQLQAGDVSANAGDSATATSGVTISALANSGPLVGATVGADGNTAGTETFGASATTTLSVDAANALVSGGTAPGTSTIETGNTTAAGFDIAASADFTAATQQAVGGNVSATGFELSVVTRVGDLDSGTVTADGNLLTAQATGGSASSTLSLAAADMSAGTPADVATATVLTDQALTGTLTATLDNSDVVVSTGALDGTASGVANATETVSADGNTLSAVGRGLAGANTLSATAAGGIGGVAAGSATLDDNASDGGDLLATATADFTVVSNQDVGTLANTTASATDLRVQVNPSGAVNTDTLSVDGNTLLAQGSGASVTNALTAAAGGSAEASAVILSTQDSAGDTNVDLGNAIAIVQLNSTATSSTVSVESNVLRATASGISGDNTLTASAGGAVTGAGAGVLTLDNATSADAGTADQLLLSAQRLTDATASVDADVTTADVSLIVQAAVATSTLLVDGNTVGAAATGISGANNVALSAGTALGTAAAGIGSSQESLSAVDATVTGLDGGQVLDLTVAAGGATGSTLSASDNTLSAAATGLTVTNGLSAAAGTTATGDGTASADVLTAQRSAAGVLATSDAERMVLSDQFVAASGNVTATVDTDLEILMSVTGALTSNSTANVDRNRISAASTIAGATNTLASTAATSLSAGGGLVSVQESLAGSTATIDDADVELTTTAGITGTSTATLSSNAVQASARGLTATNSLTASAASIAGTSAETLDVTLAANEATIANDGLSALVNVQQQSGAVTAQIAEGADNEGTVLDVNTTVITGSTVALDANAVTAQAVGVSAGNTLTQAASGSIANGSAANLASVQEIGAGATQASITGLTLDVGATGAVTAGSTVSVDGNAALASATGGTVTNLLSVDAGTSFTGDTTADASIVFGAGSVALDSLGDADLGSIQVSGSAVSALLQQGTDGADPDEFPTASATLASVSASTVTVDGNSLRALATNLSATNTVALSAGTELATVTGNLLNAQDVNAATSATVSGAQAALISGSGAGAFGAAANSATGSVSDNLIVAAGTGATATNRLTAAAADISGAGAATDLSFNLNAAGSVGLDSGTTDATLAVLNAQTLSANVTATLADGRPGDAAGSLRAYADVGAVDGTLSVERNLLVAQARGLTAANSLSADIGNSADGAAMAVGSVQDVEGGTITAQVNAGSTAGTDIAFVGIDAAAVSGTLSLQGNVAQAAALSNLATNSLSVAANGSTSNMGTEATTTLGANTMEVTGAGFTLGSAQRSATAVVSTLDNLEVEVATTGNVAGTVTVDGNSVLTDARSNFASNNAVSLQVGNDLAAAGSLANQQLSSGALTSSINAGNALNTGAIGLAASANFDGAASVSENRVMATATQNQALNTLVLNAATLQAATGGSVGAGTATSDYVALNAQTNTGSASALLNRFTVGANFAGAAPIVSGTVRVEDNLLMAGAAGNVASNMMTIDAAGNARGDFAFGNVQSNSGVISALATSARVELVAAGTGAVSGTYRLAGNSIGATAQGNVSSTRLGMTGSSFSNF